LLNGSGREVLEIHSIVKEFEDNYSDDPIEPEASKDIGFSKLFSFVGIAALLVIGSTFAANINLNSGQNVEFGQGVSVATSCDNSITVTPYSSFTNISGGGNFYFSSFKLSGVDVNSCNGATFSIKVYDSSTAAPLTLFGTSNQVLITDSGTAFSLNSGQSGLSLSDTGTIGSVTINISSPLALASSVNKITLETSGNVVLPIDNGSSSRSLNTTFEKVGSSNLYASIASSSSGARIYAVSGTSVYISSDTGTSWSSVTLPYSIPGSQGNSVVTSADGLTVAVSGTGKIFVSLNGGSTWVQKYSDNDQNFDDLSMSQDGSIIQAFRCTTAPTNFLYSSNSGSTWSNISSPNPSSCGYKAFGMNSAGSILVASVYNDQIYKSANNGSSWTALSGAGSRYWSGLAVSGNGNYILAVAHNDYAYLSTDSGSNWTRLSTPISSYWQTASMTQNGRVMAVASTNGDIYTSVDYGSTWTEINGVGTAPNYWYSSAISGDGKFLFLGESSYGSGDFIYKIAIPGA